MKLPDPDCPCCGGTGREVVLADESGWREVYWCICCVGGGTTHVKPGKKIPKPS